MTSFHYVDSVASTQDVVHQLAADGAPAGTTVVAVEQYAARGSRGRRWHSPRGGLWLSVLLRPKSVVALEILSLRSGLTVADVLDATPGLPPVALKWPNDLILQDRKVGGLLGEARWQGGVVAWVVVGLGLNVSNPLPPVPTWPATRLSDYCPELTPARLAEPIARAIITAARWDPVLDASELTAFERRDWLRGRALSAPVAGYAAGIARDGALIVQGPDGREDHVRVGSITLAGQSGDG